MDLLPNKMTILLERNEQRYKEIHCLVYPLLQRKSEDSSLSTPDDRDSSMSFDKIAIDLITECETSSAGNKHILTIIDNLTGWPGAFPITDKLANTIVSTFINQYLPVHMCPRYILSSNVTEFKNQLMDKVFNNWELNAYFLHHTTHKVMEN